MRTDARLLLAAALAAALVACGDDIATPPGLLLSQPSAVAAFRGITFRDARVQPYLAVANAGSNDLTILNAVDDTIVPAPLPLRALVYPVPGRPVLLASAELGDDLETGDEVADRRPDLLVAVSAGDSRLQVIRTWDSSGAIDAAVELGGDILDLVALPSDPAAPGTARIAAALSGSRIAVARFSRAATGDAIVADAATVTPVDVGSQPVALAAMPDDPGRLWAATPDANGVLEIAVPAAAAPSLTTVLDAGAPTRLVAAARLAGERPESPAGALDPLSWATTTSLPRVYAVLDESGCGDAPLPPCGLVALDPDLGGVPPLAGGSSPRATIQLPARALALAASGPPAAPPSTAAADQVYTGPFMRIFPGTGARPTTGVAAVAASDGALYFVDLGRWELPGNAPIAPTATVVSADPSVIVTSTAVTAGFTPTARWTATWQGELLPALVSRRVDVLGATRVAFQVPGGAGFGEVIDVAAAGIAPGDLVVVADPDGLGSCRPSFEARVVSLVPADPGQFPGGALEVVAAQPQWEGCLAAVVGETSLRATVRAGAWVLVRGVGLETKPAARAAADPGVLSVSGPRVGYAPDAPLNPDETPGPALALELDPSDVTTTAPPPRGARVVVDTNEGRAHFRVGNLSVAVDPRSVVPFDRSRYAPPAGVRFLVPYSSNALLDASPSAPGGGAVLLR